MPYSWSQGSQALPSTQGSPHGKAFNVHASFTPKPSSVWAPPEVKLPLSENPQVRSEPLGAPQWHIPSQLPASRHEMDHAFTSPYIELSGCVNGNESLIVDAVKRFGDLETEPVINPVSNTLIARYFDDRSAAQALHYFSSIISASPHLIFKTRLLPLESVDAVSLVVPWGVKITREELQAALNGVGDVAQLDAEITLSGVVSKAMVLFHDRRITHKLAKGTLVLKGVQISPQLVATSLSAISNQVRALPINSNHAHAPRSTSSLIGISPRARNTSEMMSIFNGSKNLHTGLHQALPSPYAVSPLSKLSQPQYGEAPSTSQFSVFNNALSQDPRSSDSRDGAASLHDHSETASLRQERPPSFANGASFGNAGPLRESIVPPSPSSSSSKNSLAGTSLSGSSNSSRASKHPAESFSSLDSLGSNSSVTTADTKDSLEEKLCLESLRKFYFNSSNDADSERRAPRSSQNHRNSAPKADSSSKGAGSQLHPAKDSTTIDLTAIDRKKETRTTVMVRNIPNKLEFEDFKRFVDETNKSTYEFLYLRFDFCNRCNVGYAFISFNSPQHVKTFVQKRTGMKWNEYNYNSEKVIEIRFARIQGCDNLIQKFRNSPVMHQEVAFRPRLYYTKGPLAGTEKPFPENKS